MILALTELWLRSAPMVVGSLILLAWSLVLFLVTFLVADKRGWYRARRALPAQTREELIELRFKVDFLKTQYDTLLRKYAKACEERNVSKHLAHLIEEELNGKPSL